MTYEEGDVDEITPEVILRYLAIRARVEQGSTEGEKNAARRALEKMQLRYEGIAEVVRDAEARARKRVRYQTVETRLKGKLPPWADPDFDVEGMIKRMAASAVRWSVDQLADALGDLVPGLTANDIILAAKGVKRYDADEPEDEERPMPRRSRDRDEDTDEKPKKRKRQKEPTLSDMLDEAAEEDQLSMEISVDPDGSFAEVALTWTFNAKMLAAMEQDPEGFVRWLREEIDSSIDEDDEDED